jgi:type VI protein secretion system component VasK
MLIIGLLLLLAAVAVIAYVMLATAGMTPVEISYGVLNVEVAPLWLFLSGVITLAVGAIGIWLMAAGARSKARKAREVRELRKQAKEADRRAVRTSDADNLGQPSGMSGTTPTTARPGGSTPPPGSHPGAASTERNRLEPDR